jgi:uncharacterized protein YlxP (DUF503 family)
MVAGTALVELELPDGGTLKDKRRVVRSLVERVRLRFQVACAEVGRLDDHHRAALGVAAVGNDSAHVRAVLARVEGFLAGASEAALLSFEVEIVRQPAGCR